MADDRALFVLLTLTSLRSLLHRICRSTATISRGVRLVIMAVLISAFVPCCLICLDLIPSPCLLPVHLCVNGLKLSRLQCRVDFQIADLRQIVKCNGGEQHPNPVPSVYFVQILYSIKCHILREYPFA